MAATKSVSLIMIGCYDFCDEFVFDEEKKNDLCSTFFPDDYAYVCVSCEVLYG